MAQQTSKNAMISLPKAVNNGYLMWLGIAGMVLLFMVAITIFPDSKVADSNVRSGMRGPVIDGTMQAIQCGALQAVKYNLPRSGLARCLDGSQPAFYFRSGHGDGIHKWQVHFEGGGWCFDLDWCQQRSKTYYGSSKTYPNCLPKTVQRETLSQNKEMNPLLYNWNTVMVKYCDGTSYAGDTTHTFKDKELYFRGRHNRDETIQFLLQRLGMSKAETVVIAGCSAGALGVYLGIDHMTNMIHSFNSTIKVRGLALSGFFPEYTSNLSLPTARGERDDGIVNDRLDYPNAMRRLFTLANMSSGANHACVKQAHKHGSDSSSSSNCVLAEHLAPMIKTPTFSLQPQYDSWQLAHIEGGNLQSHAVNKFGAMVMDKMIKAFPADSPHGLYVESCAHHCFGCSSEGGNTWTGTSVIDDKHQYSPGKAFALWLEGNTNENQFLQNATYPCTKCCHCTAKPRNDHLSSSAVQQ